MYRDKNSNKTVRIKKDLLVWCFILAVMTAIAVGDVGQGPVESTSKKKVNWREVDVSADETDASVGEPIQSFKFEENFSLRDALAMLGSMYQKNIVPSPSVKGVLAFRRLSNVTFEEAMDAILGESFEYEQKGNLIKVYTKEEYKKIKDDKERRVQKVFTLYYVNAAEMQKLIQPVLSTAATIAASSAAKTDTQAGDSGDSLAMHDTLVVYDFPENIEKVSKIVSDIDVKPSEILVEVTILEAELKDETEFGIDLSSVGGTTITSGATEGISTTGFASAVTGTSGLTAALSIDDVTGFIRALESVTNTTVLANPKILALNKQAGHLLIGAKDGYLTTTQVTAEGRVQEVKFLETGTTLKFRPYICKNGYIRMEIYPEQSEGSVEAVGDYVLPSETTTEVKTNIMVKDGKTVVIGGLFKEETKQTYSQVPVLGDLPLVGPIFRQTKDTSVRKELIILITPHLIQEPEETYGDERAEDVKRISHGTRKSLNCISRARIYDDRYARAVKYYINGDFQTALSELNRASRIRPSALEALRLKERIIGEISPDELEQIERIMLNIIEREESEKWMRR